MIENAKSEEVHNKQSAARAQMLCGLLPITALALLIGQFKQKNNYF